MAAFSDSSALARAAAISYPVWLAVAFSSSSASATKDGYWTTFDWNSAFELAVPITGLQYSGQYGFTETYMYWATTHMVQPAANALQCESCHGENGRMDWEALGYPGDPIEWGGRNTSR